MGEGGVEQGETGPDGQTLLLSACVRVWCGEGGRWRETGAANWAGDSYPTMTG